MCTDLKRMYDHLKATVFPRARYEWMQLRFQDFKIIVEYNSTVFRIVFQLKLYGEIVTDEDMIEKILTTFHTSNTILQQQYREKGFKNYSELISCLLMAKQHNAFKIKTHKAHPTEIALSLQANKVEAHDQPKRRKNWGQNNMCGRGNDRK